MSLEELIAIDTQNPGADYAAITRYLRGELKARGARVCKVAGNVLGTWGTPRLLYNAHMDTVRAEGWSRDPLQAWTQSGRIYGLGACDTKGNIQAILDATKSGAKDLAVLFSTDEECGPKTGASKFLQTVIGKSLASGLHEAIVMEPTENQVIARHPGYVQIELTFRARGGHSSSKKKSATGVAVGTLDALQRKAGWNVNIASIGAQAAGANIRAPQCRATVSIRSYEKAGSVLRDVKAALPRGTSLEIRQAEGPLDNRKPFVPSKTEVPYWTDAATFAAVGVNTVVYGAGSIKQAHKPDEFVSHSSLEKAAAFLERTMEKR